MADYWAHTFCDDPKAAEEVEDEDFDIDKVAELIAQSSPDDWEEVT